MPKSNTISEPLPCKVTLYGWDLSVMAFLFSSDRVLTGRTVRDAGAKMFFSHGPLNAVSVGPEQEVLRQHASARADETRSNEPSIVPSQFSRAMVIAREVMMQESTNLHILYQEEGQYQILAIQAFLGRE